MNVSNKTKIRVAKSLCFISIFLILLSITSGALIPNHNHAENVGYKLSILNTKEDICDIDVFFIGKSHMENGVSPMKIYKDNGITTYNLSSAAQPITGAKYLVEEIFNKGGAPQVIMLDASSMFNPISEADVRYITDNVKRDTNCLNYIYDYIFESTRNENSSHYALLEKYLSLIFPIYQYHSRWDKLSVDSFDFSDNNQYFLQGYTLMSSMQQCDCAG
ncbi:hypothetical protein [Butyrivibrio fibrisolvens]|uniref:hypothetical protein n=1 Tax=Butyrivibrio fibrisolvens TaxID=831 RepID=UPI0003F67A92|nr:hypothetical protein [Butyrivibrio fibrisolvens]